MFCLHTVRGLVDLLSIGSGTSSSCSLSPGSLFPCMLSSAPSDSLSTSFNFLKKDAFLVTWCLWFSAIIFVPLRSVTVYGVDSNLVVNLSFFLCFRITQSPTFSSDGLACLFLFVYSLPLLFDLASFSSVSSRLASSNRWRSVCILDLVKPVYAFG